MEKQVTIRVLKKESSENGKIQGGLTCIENFLAFRKAG